MPDTFSPVADATQPATLLSWQAPSQPLLQRSKRWYAIGGAVVVACAAYGILSGAWTFSVVIILCAVVFFLMRNHVPTFKSIAITDKGVLFEQHFAAWQDLSGFWILETHSYRELHFVFKRTRQPDIVILTGTMDLEQLRMTIAPFIPELTDKRENMLDALIRITKL